MENKYVYLVLDENINAILGVYSTYEGAVERMFIYMDGFSMEDSEHTDEDTSKFYFVDGVLGEEVCITIRKEMVRP